MKARGIIRRRIQVKLRHRFMGGVAGAPSKHAFGRRPQIRIGVVWAVLVPGPRTVAQIDSNPWRVMHKSLTSRQNRESRLISTHTPPAGTMERYLHRRGSGPALRPFRIGGIP